MSNAFELERGAPATNFSNLWKLDRLDLDWIEDIGQLALPNLELLLVVYDVEDAGIGEFKALFLHNILFNRLESVQLSKYLLVVPVPLIFLLEFLLRSCALIVRNSTDSEHSWRE